VTGNVTRNFGSPKSGRKTGVLFIRTIQHYPSPSLLPPKSVQKRFTKPRKIARLPTIDQYTWISKTLSKSAPDFADITREGVPGGTIQARTGPGLPKDSDDYEEE